jgi:hypothetical protein
MDLSYLNDYMLLNNNPMNGHAQVKSKILVTSVYGAYENRLVAEPGLYQLNISYVECSFSTRAIR